MREQRRPEVLRSRHVARRLQFASPWPSLAGSHPERPQCFFFASLAGTEALKLERNRAATQKIRRAGRCPDGVGCPASAATQLSGTQAGLPTIRFMVTSMLRENQYTSSVRATLSAQCPGCNSPLKSSHCQPSSARLHRALPRDSCLPPSELPLPAAGIAPRVIPRERQMHTTDADAAPRRRSLLSANAVHKH